MTTINCRAKYQPPKLVTRQFVKRCFVPREWVLRRSCFRNSLHQRPCTADSYGWLRFHGARSSFGHTAPSDCNGFLRWNLLSRSAFNSVLENERQPVACAMWQCLPLEGNFERRDQVCGSHPTHINGRRFLDTGLPKNRELSMIYYLWWRMITLRKLGTKWLGH